MALGRSGRGRLSPHTRILPAAQPLQRLREGSACAGDAGSQIPSHVAGPRGPVTATRLPLVTRSPAPAILSSGRRSPDNPLGAREHGLPILGCGHAERGGPLCQAATVLKGVCTPLGTAPGFLSGADTPLFYHGAFHSFRACTWARCGVCI